MITGSTSPARYCQSFQRYLLSSRSTVMSKLMLYSTSIQSRASTSRHPDDRSGRATVSELGASPLASTCFSFLPGRRGNPQGRSAVIGRLRVEWGLPWVLPMRLDRDVLPCRKTPASHGTSAKAYKKRPRPSNRRSSTSHLLPSYLPLNSSRPPLRPILVLWCSSINFTHLTHHHDHQPLSRASTSPSLLAI